MLPAAVGIRSLHDFFHIALWSQVGSGRANGLVEISTRRSANSSFVHVFAMAVMSIRPQENLVFSIQYTLLPLTGVVHA